MIPRPLDAIVVLGCRVEDDGELSSTLRRRADWAVVAHRVGLGHWVVPSGGRRWGAHVEADRLEAYLAGRGVPKEVIYPELMSLTTAENAVFSAELLGRIGARRALVVTCAWHMPRALASFRALGVDALPLPVPEGPSSLWDDVRRAAHEAVSRRLDAWTVGRVRRARRRRTHPFDAEERAR